MVLKESIMKPANYIYYAGLLLLTASLPLSKFAMSISQFMIVGGWLLSGDLISRLRTFMRSTPALLLVSIFLLHIIGLAYTSDFNYAFKDIRIKLPLLLLPVILSSANPITEKQFNGILLALIAGTFVSSMISIMILLGWLNYPVNDIRDISIFISHIRLSLLCCLSVFVIIWLLSRKSSPYSQLIQWLLTIAGVWLLFFIIILESLTGVAVLLCSLIFLPLWMLFRGSNRIYKSIILFTSIALPLFAFLYVKSVYDRLNDHEQVDFSKLEQFTPSGRPYHHNREYFIYENGNMVWIYVNEDELREQWNKRSNLSYDGKDKRDQELRFTLVRFLASKGMRKDSAAVVSLSESEVKSIEKGIANVDYQQIGSLGARLHQVMWEIHNLQSGGDPSGHSAAQRFEFWSAATGIIRKHPFTGVGTGDPPAAFREQYIEMNSKLSEKWRLRSHNQYLSIAVAFGVPGLLWFIFVLLSLLYTRIKRRDFLYCSFALAAIVSMITEDTLETQAGITFFALFSCLFLFVNPSKEAGHVK